VFNALALISLSGVLGAILLSNMSSEAKMVSAIVFFLWVLGQTVWVLPSQLPVKVCSTFWVCALLAGAIIVSAASVTTSTIGEIREGFFCIVSSSFTEVFD